MPLANANFAGHGEALSEFKVAFSGGPDAREEAFLVPANWRGKYGASLAGETLRLRLVGNLSGPAIVVIGGISAGRFVANEGNGENGWWGDIACTDGAIDLSKYCIVGTDYIPGDPESVLDLCPEDYAELLHFSLLQAGISKLYAFVGSSFGGMIGLAFVRRFPNFVERLAVICAAHQPHPMAQAWRLIQRRTIELGLSAGKPEEGVNLARQLAITTYRSPEEFGERFDPDLESNASVDGYLKAHGLKYADKVSATRYITLSAAIDRHKEDPAAIHTPTLLMGALTDRLVPVSDISVLQQKLAGPTDFVAISSIYGHDAFLKETTFIGQYLKNFLTE